MNIKNDALAKCSRKMYTDDEILVKFEEVQRWHGKHDMMLESVALANSIRLYAFHIYIYFKRIREL